MVRIFTNLHVVDNNGPGSIGGGGTPCQPLAPPFEDEGTALDPGRQKESALPVYRDGGRMTQGAVYDMQGRKTAAGSAAHGLDLLLVADEMKCVKLVDH
jgi:hypothetical protein